MIYDEDPYVTWARQQQALTPMPQQLALPGELSKTSVGSPPPPLPPLPPPPQQMAVMGAPVQDEVPLDVAQPPLSPEEEQQIQIDQPQTALQADAVSQAAPAAAVSDMADVSMEHQAPPPTDVYGSGQVDGQNPDAYLEHMQGEAANDQLPSSRERTEQEAADRAINAMTPEQLTQYNAHRESAMLLEQARLQHEAEMANQQRAAQALQVQQEAAAKADADTQDVLSRAHDLSVSTVNPERYKAQRGVGGTIRDMAMMFFSGLGGNADGAMRTLDNRIARDIDAQKMAIDNGWKGVDLSRSEIAQEYARHGDLYRAAETYRIAAYNSAINDIQTQLQMYDPAGSSALRARAAMDQLQSQIAQATQSLYATQFKNHITALETSVKVRDQQLKEQQYADKRAGVLGAGAKPIKPNDVVQPVEYFQAVYGKAPPMPMSENGYEQWAKTGKVVQEYSKAERENSPEDRARQLSVGEIVDDQGQPVQFRSAEMAGKIADTKASVDTVSQHIDELVDLYNEHGYEPDFLKSAAWQQAQGALASALLESKNADQLGALSGSDIDLEMKKISGGVDPTGIRNPIAALQSAKRRAVTKVNSVIRAQAVLPQGRHIKPWAPPNTAASTMASAKKDVVDELGTKLTKALYKQVPTDTGNPLTDFKGKLANEIYKPLDKDADKWLLQLGAFAEQTNDMGDRARKVLAQLAEKSVYPEMKAKAQEMLKGLPGANRRTDEAR